MAQAIIIRILPVFRLFMLTAHAPAGYITARLLIRLKPPHMPTWQWSLIGITGGLLPNVDMLWFYFIDHGHVHHHRYLTHWPVLWLTLLLITFCYHHYRCNAAAAILLLTAVNGCIHICLDSIVGDIYWLLPWHDSAYSFFTVTARFQPWWLNFILHWTFLLEPGLWLWAGILYNRTRRL